MKPFLRIEERIYPLHSLSFSVSPGEVSVFVTDYDEAIATYQGENAKRFKAWLRAHTEQIALVDDSYASFMEG